MTRHWKPAKRTKRKQPKLPAPFRRRHQHLINITELNARVSPLLRLPSELRNLIYYFVFSEDVYIHHTSRSRKSMYSSKYRYRHSELDLPSTRIQYPVGNLTLLHTCYQLHQEAVLLPFAVSQLYFNSLSALNHIQHRFKHWQRKAIQKMIFATTFRRMHDRFDVSLRDLPSYMPGVRYVKVYVAIWKDMLSAHELGMDSSEWKGRKLKLKHRRKMELKEWLQGSCGQVSVRFGNVFM